MSRGERRTHEPLRWIVGVARNSKKNVKNPLTNSPTCDTMCIQGKGNQAKVKKKDLKNRKKFLTNPTKCGIIKTPRGQEPLVNKKWVATIADMKGVYYD
jgi:hypothetical protein